MSDKRLHVLHVCGALNRGGAEIMMMDIYRNISSNTRFDFLINYKIKAKKPVGDFDNEIIQMGGRLKHIGTQWDLGVVKYIVEFKKIINEIGRPDVVHIHLNSRCGVIALAARLCGIKKIIAHSHDILLFEGPLLASLPAIIELKLQKLLIALFATDYWACSAAASESLFYGWMGRIKKSVIIKNAINVSAFQMARRNPDRSILAKYGLSKDSIVIGNVGRVIRRKNVDYVMDVLKELRDMDVDFLFVFAGRVDDECYMSEVMCKAKNNKIDDMLVYLGDQDNIPAIMCMFDVFIAPNKQEGFGMTAVEAQAAGLPCLLSNGFTEDVDMSLGLVSFMDGWDPRGWAEKIITLKREKNVSSTEIYEKFTARGFDSVANAALIEGLYKE